ncbi:DUF4198 domain-containing protein [Parahaliea mediterranea]|uniref:DUF4198 domain-containing protein n=1 Tax=Parahaliea mediterranea TaxID=651086 RepID=UPI000E2EA7E8|nr:DUF4198 domain-containing protein [Parahaliea mediterranea]
MKKALLILCCVALSTPALGHTPYLAPNTFEPLNGTIITLDAAFAEHFFVPEVAFDNDKYTVRHPDGSEHAPDTLSVMKTRAVLEHTLADEGTYRFSTGRRMGRINRFYELDGKRAMAEDPAAELPAGARELAFFQSVTQAETYVTRGAPNRAVLAPHNAGVEFEVLGHPNAVFAGEPLALRVLFQGSPLPGQEVHVFRASGLHGSTDPVATLTSNPDGAVDFTPAEGGIYLLRTRHRAAAPLAAPAPEYSHTYTLVLEAIE